MYLRSRGDNPICPGHAGFCSANLKRGDPIGLEELYGTIIAEEIGSDPDPLAIGFLTTDGDSHAFKGFREKQLELVNVDVENLRDLRHLSKSQMRAIDNAEFSMLMFDARTKAKRRAIQRRFSLDLTARCATEFNFAIRELSGDVNGLVSRLSYVTDAIVDCYSGHCGRNCETYSYVCDGREKSCWTKEYLPENSRCLYMTDDDERLMRDCIKIRFGRENIHKTRFGTTTQKVEAIHTAYSASNPKDVTSTRNFNPRIHSSAHRLNHGPGNSSLRKCEALKCPLPTASRVIKQLKKEDKKREYDIKRQKSPAVKARATRSNLDKFKLHDDIHEETEELKTYESGMNDPKLPKRREKRTEDDHRSLFKK